MVTLQSTVEIRLVISSTVPGVSCMILLLLLHPFNGHFSRTTWVSQHQKGKPFCIFLEQEMMRWQWHQLNHMQITCTSHQAGNHISTSPQSFYRPDALPAAQPTASKHWKDNNNNNIIIIVIIMKTIFMVLSSSKANEKVHPIHLTNANWVLDGYI